MDGLILLTILSLLVFFVLLATLLNRTGAQKQLLESLYEKISQLSREVSSLSKELREKKEDKVVKPLEETPPVLAAKKEIITAVKEIIPEQPEVKTATPEMITPVIPVPETTGSAKQPESEVISSEPGKPVYELPAQEERDIEKYIGENLANKIGIGVLVLGIAFFIKYAIDKNWVNEWGRVMIGFICGAILIGLAHRLRHRYRSFSSVLVGGGLSVFYLSIAFAFHQYHLIGQTTAFISMVSVSGFAVLLSVLYDRQELAILAAVGGFITPFLVSTGNENYVALFTYLCILNAGFTALSWFKRWPAINIISLFFTTIIFGGWLFKHLAWEEGSDFPSANAFLFATLFYGLFLFMNIVNTLRLKNKFTAFDFIILLGVNFLYYAAGVIILDHWNISNGKGFFTLGLGVTNLVLAAVFSKKKSADKNFVALLTGLSLTFLSLTVPVLFKGNHIVLSWAAEAVVLLFLYHRTGIMLLKKASVMVTVAMLASLVLNWVNVYIDPEMAVPIVFNKGFITGLAAAISLLLLDVLNKRKQDQLKLPGSSSTIRWELITSIAVLYVAGFLELKYQFSKAFPEQPLYAVYLQAYTFAFAAVLLLIFRNNKAYAIGKLVATTACFLFFVRYINTNQDVSLALLKGYAVNSLFIAHWVAAVLLCWLLYDSVSYFYKQRNTQWQSYLPAISWIGVISLVIVLSIELYHVVMWIGFRDEQDWEGWKNLYQKAGLSILWGLCSFLLMWLGMKKGLRTLRIISLSLFTVTLVKLFAYDIRNIPPGGKIAAFILLGVLLLVVSFMYQQLKKIITDNKDPD
ncbi:MAG: DUF2339 domain-containing protein [Chitinophagaceae bacterium]|nr:DUF2339 domain-containing protein [Chitinophagaceae bacterium]